MKAKYARLASDKGFAAFEARDVGLVGILEAGAAYVPIDPKSPPERASRILRDCGLTVLLTSRKKRDLLPSAALLASRRSGVVECWKRLADAMPGRFAVSSAGLRFPR